MGIKFHCPNGHKMNVKSFLAGKKGVCPKCGIGVEVPLVSEGQASAGRAKAPASTPAASPSAASAPAMADTIAEEAEVPSFGMVVATEIETAVAAADGPADTNGRSASGKSAAGMPAVIAQDPLALWYTCTQSGDRYGPVSGEVLHRWLGEGRVAGNSLVWRDGWPEWQKASAVFPSLNPAAALADLSSLFPGLTPAAPAAAASPAAAQPKMDDLLADALAGATTSATTYISTSRRRSYKDKLVLSSMVLIGAAILLGVTLMLVLLNQK